MARSKAALHPTVGVFGRESGRMSLMINAEERKVLIGRNTQNEYREGVSKWG